MFGAAFSKLKHVRARVIGFFSLSENDTANESRFRNFVHFWMFVWKNFSRNRCPARASALAYTTLLALVPVLAVGIAISASILHMNDEKKIQSMLNQFVERVAPQLGLVSKTEEGANVNARKEVVESIYNFVERVNSGTLKTTATIALLFIAISLLSTIENTLNDIWAVPKGRSWADRIVKYCAAIMIGPILLFGATALNTGPYFDTTKRLIERLPFIGNVIYNFLPAVVLTIAFSIFFRLMPNTKVKWTACFAGGAVGGVLWHLNSLLSVLYIGQVVRNMKFYGSLGVVPIFLVGIYFSWWILLFAAQAAETFQNRKAYMEQQITGRVNQAGREFVALRIMTLVANRFFRGDVPATATQISDLLHIPSTLTRIVTEPLVCAGLLIEVAPAGKDEIGFSPARPLERISCQDILDAMRRGIGRELATREDPARELLRLKVQLIRDAERGTASEITLADLAKAHAE